MTRAIIAGMSLGDKYPQLATILAAIAERKATGTVTSRCPACGEVLAIAEAPGRLVVSCRCGHCRYSQRTRID